MHLPDHIYHLAEASNLPSIEREGLHCATSLIKNAELGRKERTQLENAQRLEHMVLPSGVHIRDQRPMPPQALQSCLHDMTPAQWYALINSRVFFWLDPDRLNRQRTACGSRPQVVLTIDTDALIKSCKKSIAVTPINTGNARRKPAKRGTATFVPLTDWLETAWHSEAAALGITERKRSHVPVELTVHHAVPDAMNFVLRMDKLKSGQAFVPR